MTNSEDVKAKIPYLALNPGDNVLFQTDEMAKSAKAVYVGMLPGENLVLSLPLSKDSASFGIGPGKMVAVKYFGDGCISAFHCMVLARFNHSSTRIVLTSYPRKIHKQVIRKEARLSCCLPARITSAEEQVSGIICDLASGGAGFECSRESLEAMKEVPDKGLPVELTIEMLDGENVKSVACWVRSKNGSRHKALLGLEFSDEESDSLAAIRQYVEKTLEMLRHLHGEAE